MPMPAFSFSVGDFVACTSLIVAAVQALRGSSDDIRELNEIQNDLTHLKDVLDQIELAVSGGTAIATKSVDILSKTCSDCRALLAEFKKFVDENTTASSGLSRFSRRIQCVLV